MTLRIMRQYNKQQVMKDAHRLYGSKFHRKGRSWSECLRAAWGWEHDAVRAREEKAAKLDACLLYTSPSPRDRG